MQTRDRITKKEEKNRQTEKKTEMQNKINIQIQEKRRRTSL